MKKFFLTAIVALGFLPSKAQVMIGPEAGVNFSTLSNTDTEDEILVGAHAGLKAQIPVTSSFNVKPGVIYSYQGTKFDVSPEQKIKLQYINVPILFDYTWRTGLFAETGPQIGFLIDSKTEVNDNETDINDDTEDVDFSWAFGVGYKSPANLGIHARYNLGLTDVFTQNDGDAIRNSVFQVGLFYMFGMPKAR